jgi:glutathione S-transferase
LNVRGSDPIQQIAETTAILRYLAGTFGTLDPTSVQTFKGKEHTTV